MTVSEGNESLLTAETSQGMEFRAGILRLTRHLVVFEIYNPAFVLRLSEVLNYLKILARGHPVYSGRAVVSSLVNTGMTLVCEATLEETWLDVDFPPLSELGPKLREEFNRFITATQQYSTSIQVQLELSGLSRIGINPLETLRQNIAGYRRSDEIAP